MQICIPYDLRPVREETEFLGKKSVSLCYYFTITIRFV